MNEFIVTKKVTALVIAVLVAGGCGGGRTAAPTQTTPLAKPVDGWRVTRTIAGGLCQQGLCSDEMKIDTLEGEMFTVTNGVESPHKLMSKKLKDAVSAAVPPNYKQWTDFTGLCPTAYDGNEVKYFWEPADSAVLSKISTISTCEKNIPDNSPIVQLFTAAELEFATAATVQR